MALETLVGVEEIGGFKIGHDESITNDTFIAIDHSWNAIGFRIQKGPVKEGGINGCQVVTMIEAAKLIIEKLNEKYPCGENDATLAHLSEAIEWQKVRTKDREKRNVEGTNRA